MRIILNFDEDTTPLHIYAALAGITYRDPIILDIDGEPDDANDLAEALRIANFPAVELEVRYVVDNERNSLISRIADLPDGEVLNVIQAANELRGSLAERLGHAYAEVTGTDPTQG